MDNHIAEIGLLIVGATLVFGLFLITAPDQLMTSVGVLLVIISLMGLMPVVRLWIADDLTEVTPF